MSFARLMHLLKFKKLYFARLDHLEDQMEGIPVNIHLSDPHKESYLRINKYVNCWHINEHESEAMWKLYGGVPAESVAIKSSIGRVKDAIWDDPTPVIMGKVHYEDKPDEELLRSFYVQVYCKRRIYAHEQELRLCVSGSNENPHSCLFSPPPEIKNYRALSKLFVDERRPDHILVKIDLSKLIDTIVAGADWLQPLIRKIVRSIKGLGTCPVILGNRAR